MDGVARRLSRQDLEPHRNYRADETDFIIIYIVPEDAWYVLPVAAAAHARMASFFPHVANSRGRLEKFRDAWQLLGRPSRGLPRGASRKAQLSGNLPKPGRKLSKRDLARASYENKLSKQLPYRRARAAWEALGCWIFSDRD